MKRTTLLFVAALGLVTQLRAQAAPPAIPATPAAVRGVVSIQPFRLEAPVPHLWRVERPTLRSGYLLVLRVDPALVFPRQIAEPVLYIGGQTAERLNVGYESGHVVAILPAELDPLHPQFLDLSKALFWFGTPELPERVDAQRIALEHKLAVTAGIRPFTPKEIAAALERGGALTSKATKRALLRDAMQRLVLVHSPQERPLVESILNAAPVTHR